MKTITTKYQSDNSVETSVICGWGFGDDIVIKQTVIHKGQKTKETYIGFTITELKQLIPALVETLTQAVTLEAEFNTVMKTRPIENESPTLEF